MASIVARCVPGSYDTLEDAAKGLAHATLACALLGTVGYLGTGYCAGIVAMQCLLLSAMANRNAGLLKVRRGRRGTVVIVVVGLVTFVRSFVPSVRRSVRPSTHSWSLDYYTTLTTRALRDNTNRKPEIRVGTTPTPFEK